MDHHEKRLSLALFVAIIATALYLSAELAHLFAFPNKIGMAQADYFVVQAIYNGWWQFAYVLIVQVIAIVAVMVLARRGSLQFWGGLVAILCVMGTQLLFWGYTQPANVATQNWTLQPENWQALRAQWEHSHAAGAILQTAGFVALVAATVWRGGRA